MKKIVKTSVVLSSLILGINLFAEIILNNQKLEIDNTNLDNWFYLSNNSELINKNINGNRLDIQESSYSTILNNSTLEITYDWSSINAKVIDNSKIINNGTINIVGTDLYSPINVISIDVLNLKSSLVENNGSIITNLNSDADIDAIVIRNSQNSIVRNNGLIDLKADADYVNLNGIQLDGWDSSTNISGSSEIINNKDIIITSTGKDVSSYGITAYEEFLIDNTKITNNGKISVKADGLFADSAAMELYYVNNSTITNNGSIEAKSTILEDETSNDKFSDSYGILVEYADNIKIENSGTIDTNSNNKYSNFAISESISVSELKNSTILNSGKLKSTINGDLNYSGSSMIILNSQNTNVHNTKTGEMYGNIIIGSNIENNDSSFKNEGFISLPYNANKNAFFDLSNNEKVSLQPNMPNLINSGTIEIGAYKDSNNNIENTQIKTTNATFETGSKMQVAVLAGSKPFNMGDTLAEVVKSINKIEGVENIKINQTKIADSSALLNFELKYNESKNQIDLVVAKLNTLEEIEEEIGSTITNNSSNPVSTIFSYNATQVDIAARKIGNENILGQLQTVNLLDYENALESLVPTTQLSALSSSDQINSNVSNIIFSRLQDIPSSGLNSGDEMVLEDDNRLWVKAFGSLGNQRDKDEVYGFDISTYGIGLGYDKEHMPNQFLGLATFYTRAQTETNHINHKNDIDAYSVVAYGSNLLYDDKTTIYYQASHTWQKNSSIRELFTNEKANSEFTSNTIATDLKVGHKINLNDQTTIEPKIGLEYSYYNSPVIKENGSKNGNLKTNKFNSEKLAGTIGADIEYKINSNSKIITTVKTGYDFKNDKNKRITSSFVNNPNVLFNSEGINNGRLSYEAGIAYEISVDERNNFNIAYKYIEEGKFRNNVLMVNYDYKF